MGTLHCEDMLVQLLQDGGTDEDNDENCVESRTTNDLKRENETKR